MQGSWNHEHAYYRCRYPTEYALPRGTQHQATVYVREAQIVQPLDDWISGIFEADRLEETCRVLAEAQEPAPEADGRAEAARRTLADCDARLDRYREALESGVDPAVVARWISEVQFERRSAEEELRRRRPAAALTEDDIRAMVESLADLVGLLQAANAEKRAALYQSLRLSLIYDPSKRSVLVEADLGGVRPVRVGGAIRTTTPRVLIRGELTLAA
jgi:site-specific DNA recombinase